jgi:hypothetical protein
MSSVRVADLTDELSALCIMPPPPLAMPPR